MKNFKRKVSALVLSTLFASMHVSYAAGLSDAAINKIEGGMQDRLQVMAA